jgi:hypothetical protein
LHADLPALFLFCAEVKWVPCGAASDCLVDNHFLSRNGLFVNCASLVLSGCLVFGSAVCLRSADAPAAPLAPLAPNAPAQAPQAPLAKSAPVVKGTSHAPFAPEAALAPGQKKPKLTNSQVIVFIPSVPPNTKTAVNPPIPPDQPQVGQRRERRIPMGGREKRALRRQQQVIED